jgi:hypothetical protein
MDIPIQAQPVIRTSFAPHRANGDRGVYPSGDCTSGFWCCGFGDSCEGAKCYSCGTDVCVVHHEEMCNSIGGLQACYNC